MRVVVIGGTGHVGSYLVPRLLQAGHEVVVVSRGLRAPYSDGPLWNKVEWVTVERAGAEKAGTFGVMIRDLQPQVVFDMLCYHLDSVRQLVEALDGQVVRFLHCGTVWVHGYPVEVPMQESAPRRPICTYGANKVAVEEYLLGLAKAGRFPATVIHPGHIVGEGWIPLNPQGNFNPAVYEALAHGDEVTLPHLGLETLHHVHADDVAQLFELAFDQWSRAVGESFFAVSPAALTFRGFAESVADWFEKSANLRFLPLEAWTKTMSPQDADAAYGHLSHGTNCSPQKAMARLGYAPRSSLVAVRESVDWLIAHGKITV